MSDRDPDHCLVLCSGGLDSTGALMRAVLAYGAENVSVLAFRYGQPAADAELHASQMAAAALGVRRWECAYLSDVLRGGIVQEVKPAGVDAAGVNNANVPARNFLFIAAAVCRAGFLFPGKLVCIVVGTHQDDAATFPDCREDFLQAAESAGALALRGVARVLIWSPWIGVKKADILRQLAASPMQLELLRASVSCYKGTRCGTCGACVQRAAAFAEAGIEDGTVLPPPMTGGDPHREARLRRETDVPR